MRRPSLSLLLLLALAAGCRAPANTTPPRVPAASTPPGTTPAPSMAAVPTTVAATSTPTPGVTSATAPPAVAALTGLVTAPASLLSDHGGALVGNHGAGLRVLAAAAEVPVAGATVRLLDAAGQPIPGPGGQPLVATTAADGSFAFPSLPAGHNLVLASDLGATGSLTALLTKDGGKQVNLNLVSTLTTTYILDQYVKGQADPILTLDKLPAGVETDTRTRAGAAFQGGGTAVPDSLAAAKVTATVESLRHQDPAFDLQMEAVKKLLIAAGLSDLGNGLPATQVDLGATQRLLAGRDGTVYLVTGRRLWHLAKDGTLVTAYDPPAGELIYDAALDGQDRPLVLFASSFVIGSPMRYHVLRVEGGGGTTDFGTVTEEPRGHWASTWGIVAGAADEAIIVTGVNDSKALDSTLSKWTLHAGRAPGAAQPLPYTLAGANPCFGRAADGTLVVTQDFGTTSRLAPGATAWASSTGSFGASASATTDGYLYLLGGLEPGLTRVDPDGTQHKLPVSGLETLSASFPTTRAVTTADGTLYLSVTSLIPSSLTKLYRVANGVLTLVAGRDAVTSGQANALPLHAPRSLAAAPNGGFLVVDGTSVLQVAADGTATTWASPINTGAYSLTSYRARADAAGNLYLGVEYDLKSPYASHPRVDEVLRFGPTGEPVKVFSLPEPWDQVGDVAVGSQGLIAVSALTMDYKATPGNLTFVPRIWSGAVATPVGSPVLGTSTSSPGLATDLAGRVYVANEQHVWRREDSGALTPYLDVGVPFLNSFAVDLQGRLYAGRNTTPSADRPTWILQRTTPDGQTTVLAGPGGRWFTGSGVDDGLGAVGDLAFATDGTLLILDTANKQVKRIPAANL
ncbi:MAG: repeat-containing protein [Cyanobacteria bacterium RYN_339]|nr:repeat-containing protein [Cyanobacteria bacterium RYN_339]